MTALNLVLLCEYVQLQQGFANMKYRKTMTKNGVDYYRIELDTDLDKDFSTLPQHWQQAVWNLQMEDIKSNRNYPNHFYGGRFAYKLMGMHNGRLHDGIWIDWDRDNSGEIVITWSGKPLEAAYESIDINPYAKKKTVDSTQKDAIM